MTPDQKRHIAQAMVNRSRQWKTRVGISVVIAVAFYSFVGPVFAACWFVTYGVIQLVERQFAPTGRLAERLGDRYFIGCLVLVFIANVVFGSMAAAQVLSGTMPALTCAGLLIGGAIMNAVLISPGSRALVAVSVAGASGWPGDRKSVV